MLNMGPMVSQPGRIVESRPNIWSLLFPKSNLHYCWMVLKQICMHVIVYILTAKNVEITELLTFWQKFRENNVFTKELISRNISKWDFFSRFSTARTAAQYWNHENFVKQTFLLNLVKTFLSRNICQKVWD